TTRGRPLVKQLEGQLADTKDQLHSAARGHSSDRTLNGPVGAEIAYGWTPLRMTSRGDYRTRFAPSKFQVSEHETGSFKLGTASLKDPVSLPGVARPTIPAQSASQGLA